MLSKSDVGIYSYPTQGLSNGRPHALQSVSGMGVNYSYDLNGNATAASAGKWRSIAYTSFNLPDGSSGIQGPGGTPKQTWQYDENHQRIRDDRVNGSGTRTTWNLHPDNQGGLGFEWEIAPNGSQSNRHYLSAGGSAFAVLVTTGALPVLTAGQTAPTVLVSVAAVKLEYLFNCAAHVSCWKVPNDSEANFYRYGTPGNGEGSYAQAGALAVIYDLDSRWGNLDSRRVGIGNVSLEDDSVFPPHSSHRDGLQIDIRPIRLDGSEAPVNWRSSQYDRAATQQLVDILRSNQNVLNVYFNDPQIKGVSPLQGHNDHLHIEVRKGP